MQNQTQQEIATLIDDDRREANASFASPARILRYMNRCNREIIKKPGVKTVKDTMTLTFTSNGEYALNTDLISIISVYAGTIGSGEQVEFHYVPPDEMNLAVRGYGYTFKSRGNIYIFASSAQALPTTTITIDYWSTNFILDDDGTTKKSKWENAGDTSRLPAYHDDLWVDFTVSKILQREGKEEWKDRFALFNSGLDSLTVEGGQPQVPRKRRSFGHFYAHE